MDKIEDNSVFKIKKKKKKFKHKVNRYPYDINFKKYFLKKKFTKKVTIFYFI